MFILYRVDRDQDRGSGPWATGAGHEPALDCRIVKGYKQARKYGLDSWFEKAQFVMNKLLGKYFLIYIVVNEKDELIHYSQIIGPGWRLPFLAPGDIEVGPCWTAEGYRGRGIYPAVLQRIIRDYPGTNIYIFCAPDNLASRHSIEKSGFKAVGTGIRTRPLGIRLIGRYIFEMRKD